MIKDITKIEEFLTEMGKCNVEDLSVTEIKSIIKYIGWKYNIELIYDSSSEKIINKSYDQWQEELEARFNSMYSEE